MAIQPLDLQVLFSRLEQVGKEQSAAKEVHAQQQLQQAGELVKRTDQQDHSVNQASEVDQKGIARLDPEEKRRRERRKEKRRQTEGEGQNLTPLEVVQDPALGKKIDISG